MDPRNNPEIWGGKTAQPAIIGNAVLPLYNQSREGVVATLRYGETVNVYAQDNNWTLISGAHDGYMGWAQNVEWLDKTEAPHQRITNLATHIYPEANIKTPPVKRLSLGSKISILEDCGEFKRTPEGYIFSKHFEPKSDAVEYALEFLGTPYLWGGGSANGIDCSGLTQLCYLMTGKEIPRDTDQQEHALQTVTREQAKRGDLVFWKGHVGILESPNLMIHATAFVMKTTQENLNKAIDRIGEPTSFKRVTE